MASSDAPAEEFIHKDRWIDVAKEWMHLDPDPETRDEMQKLITYNNLKELQNRLHGRLVFGTAGLRATMGAGSTRMNSLTVIQTSQGLAAHLLVAQPNASMRGVVIGRDARRNSEKYARAAAQALNAMGIKVHWYSDPVHTPLVPFAVKCLGAAAGIMITASHNPKDDNGYKVYWENGCQIIPPHDSQIAQAIQQHLVPLPLESHEPSRSFLCRPIPSDIEWDYFNRISRLTQLRSPLPKFVYTPLHGVGFRPFVRAIHHMTGVQAGNWQVGDYIPFEPVPKQQYPHPDFPTVRFPNPEESGALDLAIVAADRNGITLILANDPDADRLAVAEKIKLPAHSPQNQTGVEREVWCQFTGNQVGALLASHILDAVPAFPTNTKYAMLRSTVSSAMIDTMAAKRGYLVQETLTGFKWLGNVALDLEKQGIHVNFAFEEALGYMFPSIVHDKDGVSAGALFLAATAKWREDSLTPYQKLQQLYKEHGYFAEANTYLRSPSPQLTNRAFSDIRSLQDPYPSRLGILPVGRWRDLTIGYDSATEENTPNLPIDRSSHMITLWSGNNVRMTVRASGTEPKIKFYIEGKDSSWEKAERLAAMAKDFIVYDWFSPQGYGFIMAQ